MKKFELNVVNFNNEDVIATSGEVYFTFESPNAGGGVHTHVYDADGVTLPENTLFNINDVYFHLGSNCGAHGEPYLRTGTTGNEKAEGDLSDFTGYYIYDGDNKEYVFVK